MHPAESPTEMLQCYDAAGNPIEGRPRSEVKQLPYRWWYGVAKIWVVNDKGEVLCSRRSEQLSANPGKWQTYFGGHVQAGHSFLDTAQKELAEEAGIELPTDVFYFIERATNPDKKVFSESFAVRFHGTLDDLHFSDDEVSEARWIDMHKLALEQQQHPELWCNTLKPDQLAKIQAWLVS